MKESDVLERAAEALRVAHDGRRQGSGFTRARIMSSLHQKRHGRLLYWAIFSPLASLLLVGSAWAQNTGKWPVVWRVVSSVFVSVSSGVKPGDARSGPSRAPPPAEERALEAPAPVPAPPPPVVEAAPEIAPEVGAPTDVAPPVQSPRDLQPAPRKARKRAAPAAVEAPISKEFAANDGVPATSPDRARDPAADGELSQFRAAHNLHFGGDRPRDAIAAYAEYLRAYPNGRFVPEARYNTALDHVKLGDEAAARAALEPFAAGRYGSYRRKEARQLLDALR